MPAIASRFRKYHFESVAHIFQQALRAYPENVTVLCGKLSPETLARKLREAREAKNRYGWVSPLIDETLWATNADNLMFVPSDSEVLITNKANPRRASLDQPDVKSRQSVIEVSLTNPEMLVHFCWLLHTKVFNPKPSFLIVGSTDTQIKQMEQTYDIAFDKTEEGWLVL